MTDHEYDEVARWQASDTGLAEAAAHSLNQAISDLRRAVENREGLRILRFGVGHLQAACRDLENIIAVVSPKKESDSE